MYHICDVIRRSHVSVLRKANTGNSTQGSLLSRIPASLFSVVDVSYSFPVYWVSIGLLCVSLTEHWYTRKRKATPAGVNNFNHTSTQFTLPVISWQNGVCARLRSTDATHP